MAKKNSGGLFGALTMKQTDALAIRLSGAARLAGELKDHDTALEIHEVVDDLHNSWTARADAGEYPGVSKRARR